MNTCCKNKKAVIVAAWALSLIVVFALTWIIASSLDKTKDEKAPALTVGELYNLAMEDSVYAEKDEIKQLVEITASSDMVTWNEDKTKVLLLSWHRYPESYPDGSTFVCSYGDVWTFTDKEILSWYKKNNKGVTDWELRLEQLIGLPVEKEYTHVTAFWAEPEELCRPAYQTDITAQLEESMLDGSALGDFEVWFDENIMWSYFDSAYPWTRLGYTYDWAQGSGEYGLSEFLILKDSEVEVEWTVTTQEFLGMLQEGELTK